jgi:hypothetical protein
MIWRWINKWRNRDEKNDVLLTMKYREWTIFFLYNKAMNSCHVLSFMGWISNRQNNKMALHIIFSSKNNKLINLWKTDFKFDTLCLFLDYGLSWKHLISSGSFD